MERAADKQQSSKRGLPRLEAQGRLEALRPGRRPDRPDEPISRRLEDYLEAVGDLVRQTGSARVRDIAARTSVSMSTVTTSLRQLSRAGLLHYDPYELVRLTRRGQELSEKIRSRHDALAQFLVEVLQVDARTADVNACRLEHVVDDEVLGRLSLLGEFIRTHRRAGGWLELFQRVCRRRAGCQGTQQEGQGEATKDETGPARAGQTSQEGT